MNDLSELEAELKKLRPAAPGSDLLVRIERALARPQETPTAGVLPPVRSRRSAWWSCGLGLTGVAALLIHGLTFFDQTPTPERAAETAKNEPPAATGFRPVALTQVVYSREDEGLIFSPNDSAPRRRLRYETRQTMRWRNPRTGASVRISYPAEQVVLTPVSFE